MTPFEAYRTYLAIKQHFTNKNYDYFKYSGKVNAKASSFETNKQKYQFYKLSKHRDPINFMVSNFIDRDVKWVGDLLDDKSEEVYLDHQKRQQSLSYIFSNEIKNLLTPFNDNFIVKNGQHPHVLKLHRRGELSLESLIILNDVLSFFPYWNKNIQDTVLWPSLYMKCMKYKPFFNYDMFKCRQTLKSEFI